MSKPLRARGKPRMERVITPSLSIIYTPLTQKTSRKGLFLFFSPFPLLDKRKDDGDSFLPHICEQKTQNQHIRNSQFFHCATELATLLGNDKVGFILELVHL